MLIKEAAITKEIKLQHRRLTLKRKQKETKGKVRAIMLENQAMRREIQNQLKPELRALKYKESHPLLFVEEKEEEQEEQRKREELEEELLGHAHLDVPGMNEAWELLSERSVMRSERGGGPKSRDGGKKRKKKLTLSKLIERGNSGPVERYRVI